MLRINKLCLSFVFVVALVGFVFPLVAQDRVISAAPAVTSQVPLDTWYWRSPLPQGNTLNGVTYGNGIFVAVGGDGTIITSSDGKTWTSRSSGTSEWLNGVTYGNGIFVAVGGNRTILTSADGQTWRSRSSDSSTNTNHLSGVTYGNGIFVAVEDKGIILTSVDGQTWTSQSSGTSNVLRGVTYENGIFVAVGDKGIILTSADGQTWRSRSSDSSTNTNYLSGVTYGNGIFVAVGSGGIILTSVDGQTWISQSSGTYFSLYGVTYGNGIFVALGGNGEIFTSADGQTWRSQSSGTSNNLRGVTYGNGIFVAVGENRTILTSADGQTWRSRSSGSSTNTNYLSGVTYGNGMFVVTGWYFFWDHVHNWTAQAGQILTSIDGQTWRSESSSEITFSSISRVTYGNGTFVGVGTPNGIILTSADGQTWTSHSSGTSEWLRGVTYGNGIFVAVSGNGKILTSVDGKTWTSQFSGTYYSLNEVTYGNGIFVAVGGGGTIITSSDGQTWTSRFSGTSTYILGGVTYGNGTFVTVGNAGIILQSAPYLVNLYISKMGTGNGTVASTDGNIDCGSYCSETYNQGTIVTLTATPDAGSTFTGWADDCSGTASPLDVLMDHDKTCTATFILNAQVLPPEIIASPSSLNLGIVKKGVTSAPKIVTLKNTGKGNLNINNVTITGTNASEFAYLDNGCTSVSPGSSCTISVTLTATSFGKKTATLNISSNDPKKPIAAVTLSGDCKPPMISASQASVNFGTVSAGATSAIKTVTIKNKGLSDLIINSVEITGTNAAEFNRTNNCGIVTAGSSCTVDLTYEPTSTGKKSSVLGISSNDPKKLTVNVKLSGVTKGKNTSPLCFTVSGCSVTIYNMWSDGSSQTSPNLCNLVAGGTVDSTWSHGTETHHIVYSQMSNLPMITHVLDPESLFISIDEQPNTGFLKVSDNLCH